MWQKILHWCRLSEKNEVEAYFQAFERIAIALKWPNETWSLMLQCMLTGKAQEVCASLSLEESVQYDAVKNAILRAYELVPQHYRQHFHMTKKSASQTYVEFAREKSTLFDRWIKACNASVYNSLRKLLLIEEFKNSVPECTALYLNEQKVTTVQQTAILADEYALMHKTTFVRSPPESGTSFQKENEVCQTDSKVKSSGVKFRKECSYCHKVEHSIADCYSLKKKQTLHDAVGQSRGVVLLKTVSSQSSPVLGDSADDCFKPFVFEGTVSLTGKVEDQRVVKILHDTGGCPLCYQMCYLSAQRQLVKGVQLYKELKWILCPFPSIEYGLHLTFPIKGL